MISLTGSDPQRPAAFRKQLVSPVLPRGKKGVTFIEVMAAVVVLSAGLVAVYRAFFIGADVTLLLADRLTAFDLLETRIGRIERGMLMKLAPDVGSLEQDVDVAGRRVHYYYSFDLHPVADLLSVFQLDMGVAWQERGREQKIHRTVYFSGVSSVTTR